eukprot:3187130-Rhodomonas_salina.1
MSGTRVPYRSTPYLILQYCMLLAALAVLYAATSLLYAATLGRPTYTEIHCARIKLLLRGISLPTPGTDIAYGASSLPPSYAMPGTDIASGPSPPIQGPVLELRQRMALGLCYAMSGGRKGRKTPRVTAGNVRCDVRACSERARVCVVLSYCMVLWDMPYWAIVRYYAMSSTELAYGATDMPY